MPCFGNETDCFGTLKGMKKYNFILHYSCEKEYLVRKENMPFEAAKRASFVIQTLHGAWQNGRFEM